MSVRLYVSWLYSFFVTNKHMYDITHGVASVTQL